MHAKFGSRDHWDSGEVGGPYGTGCWKGIMSLFKAFKNAISYRVNNGSTTLFWEDKWCDDSPLKAILPGLYDMARNKMASVVNHTVVANGDAVGNPS